MDGKNQYFTLALLYGQSWNRGVAICWLISVRQFQGGMAPKAMPPCIYSEGVMRGYKRNRRVEPSVSYACRWSQDVPYKRIRCVMDAIQATASGNESSRFFALEAYGLF